MLANAKAFDILWIMYCENCADKVLHCYINMTKWEVKEKYHED